MMGEFGFVHMGFGWIFWPVLIVVAIFLFRRGALGCGIGYRGYGSSGAGESPMDILKQRYAKGEICKDELERMKKDIL